MAKRKDYVPSKNGDKTAWATNLKNKIPIDGPTIGLDGAEVSSIQTAAQDVVDGVNEIEAAITAKEAAVDAATTKINNGLKVIRPIVKRGKTHAAYTNSIGQNIGIVGDEHTVDVPNSKPILKVSKVPTGYQIDFDLKGYFDGINIYKMSPPDNPAFSFLARDTASPYIDTAEVTNNTRYHAFYIINDAEVGLVSDDVIVSI
ncbi:MAG: hypothetical protein IPP77_09805 [Bacteroidetes bacterium]|nr:hypothetical protein [Bacteroidota bacterium]